MTECPNGREEQLDRSRKKPCNITCHGQPCVYHCVKSVKGIVEVCAPVEKLIGIAKQIDEQGTQLSFFPCQKIHPEQLKRIKLDFRFSL